MFLWLKMKHMLTFRHNISMSGVILPFDAVCVGPPVMIVLQKKKDKIGIIKEKD